jgi:hypothetical protein
MNANTFSKVMVQFRLPFTETAVIQWRFAKPMLPTQYRQRTPGPADCVASIQSVNPLALPLPLSMLQNRPETFWNEGNRSGIVRQGNCHLCHPRRAVDYVLPRNSRRVAKSNIIRKDKYVLTDHKKTNAKTGLTSAKGPLIARFFPAST